MLYMGNTLLLPAHTNVLTCASVIDFSRQTFSGKKQRLEIKSIQDREFASSEKNTRRPYRWSEVQSTGFEKPRVIRLVPGLHSRIGSMFKLHPKLSKHPGLLQDCEHHLQLWISGVILTNSTLKNIPSKRFTKFDCTSSAFALILVLRSCKKSKTASGFSAIVGQRANSA